jgi:hypothetical protein
MWMPMSGGVIGQPRVQAPVSSDMTGWLIDQMVANASNGALILRDYYRSINPVEAVSSIQAWTSLVRTDGIWDYKMDILDSGLTLGDEGLIVLGGHEISYQAAANIHYGFVGSAATLESGLLQLGAGVAHIDDNGFALENLHYFGDDAFDNWSVRFGIYLHGLYGGHRLDELTPETFTNALNDFIAEYGGPPDL